MADIDNPSEYYWHDGEKIPLNVSEKKKAFQVDSDKRSFSTTTFETLTKAGTKSNVMDLGNGIFLFDELQGDFNALAITKPVEGIKSKKVFEAEDDSLMIVSDQLIVQFKPDVTPIDIEKLNSKNRVVVLSQNEWEHNCYLLSVPGASEDEIIEFANHCQENELVEYAQPNFIRVFKPSFEPNDTLFDQQWALRNQGQHGGIAGNDINAAQAWAITRGSLDITIAIIDDGVDYTHEDLNVNGKLLTGFDAITRRNDPQPARLDSHGTSCAGIAAAAGNNALGIVGVAPDCSIMGIRIMFKVGPNKWSTNDNIVANGINTAVARGASVINNSWSWAGPSQIIQRAIINAKVNGRGRKGCVICCAAGNNSKNVLFPATMKEVLTVSACNQFGEFKTTSSSDGDKEWGSCFGNAIDVCAPGTNITTSTIMGLSPEPPLTNYTASFKGTSAATPFVAGVAALILSVNKSLTAIQVENIICSTADDLGQRVPNIFTGFGRVNAFKAISTAQINFS